jgi:predicted branched-subunit amino acid permease
LWSTWQLSTAAGILLGTQIPASWSLEFTLTLTFIGLVVPSLKDHAGVAAATIAGATALLAFALPLQLGLVVASLAGIIAGFIVESRQ